MKRQLVYICATLIMLSCQKPGNDKNIYSAYKPVLMEKWKLTVELGLEMARPNKTLGQMRQMGKYLLVLDYGTGIHIMNAADSANIIKESFYKIPACIDFEVKGNIVYANNYRDFIMIDFTDISQPAIIKRESNAFDVSIKTPDGLEVYPKLNEIPDGTVIISYEKI